MSPLERWVVKVDSQQLPHAHAVRVVRVGCGEQEHRIHTTRKVIYRKKKWG